MTKAIAQTLHTAHTYRLHISYVLVGICALLVFMYSLNVYSVISKSASANSVIKQAQALENSVKKLDAKYIEMTSNMTSGSLIAYGLTEGKTATFITKSQTKNVVALGGNEF
jgi:hypothetical protein